MWIYILVFVLLLHTIYKERQSLGCGNFFEGVDCDNGNGKAVRGSAPQKGDIESELLNKIDHAAEYNSRFVKWRIFFILSVVMMGLLWFIIFKKFPTEWEFVVGIVVLFSLMASTSSFYDFHLHEHVKNNVQKSVDILRERI